MEGSMLYKNSIGPPADAYTDLLTQFDNLRKHLNHLEGAAEFGHGRSVGSDLAAFRLDEEIDELNEKLFRVAWEIVELPNAKVNVVSKAVVIQALANEEADDIVHVAARSLAQIILETCLPRSKTGKHKDDRKPPRRHELP
jgi:hypothetical protein